MKRRKITNEKEEIQQGYLCDDVIIEFMMYLDIYDLLNIRLVNKTFCGNANKTITLKYKPDVPVVLFKAKVLCQQKNLKEIEGYYFCVFCKKYLRDVSYEKALEGDWGDDVVIQKFEECVNCKKKHCNSCIMFSNGRVCGKKENFGIYVGCFYCPIYEYPNEFNHWKPHYNFTNICINCIEFNIEEKVFCSFCGLIICKKHNKMCRVCNKYHCESHRCKR